MTLDWIRRREYGIKNRIGDENKFLKSLYTSISPQKQWPTDDCDRKTGFGGIFNLEFSLDG